MADDFELAGKLRLNAHGQTLVLKKRSGEKSSHVMMKGLLWALYLPQFPSLKVEVPIGTRYKPDLVAVDERGRPLFWAEAGAVGKAKIETLCRKYRDAHLVFAKWGQPHHATTDMFAQIVTSAKRRAPVELLYFPEDSLERWVDQHGVVRLERGELPGQVWPAAPQGS
jgi:hypothetical protein